MFGLGWLYGSSRGRPARSCSSNILSARPINDDVMFFYESTRRMAPTTVSIPHSFTDGDFTAADVVTRWTMFRLGLGHGVWETAFLTETT
jgi:hypothetical protein